VWLREILEAVQLWVMPSRVHVHVCAGSSMHHMLAWCLGGGVEVFDGLVKLLCFPFINVSSSWLSSSVSYNFHGTLICLTCVHLAWLILTSPDA
jgi:hypothetical protein